MANIKPPSPHTLSPPPEALYVMRRRPRAETKVLLGQNYQEIVTEFIDPPRPANKSEDYTRERLIASLRYGDASLRNKVRKLSPIGGRAMMLYKDAVATILDMEDVKGDVDEENDQKLVREESLALIRTHEEAAQYRACLQLLRPEKTSTLQDAILNLQRTAFYARYGDIFAQVCNTIRAEAEAEAKKVLGWESLVRTYWTEIQRQIVTEGPTWKKAMSGETDVQNKCPVHLALSEVCTAGGFDMQETLTIISHYAIRNEIVHANFETLIKEGSFDKLKNQLFKDLCDIPKVIPFAESLQAGLMKKLVEAMINRWYITDPEEPDNVELWFPTPDLLKHRKQILAEKQGHDTYKNMMSKIAKDVAQVSRQQKLHAEMVSAMGSNWGLSEGGVSSKKKRVSSADYKAEAAAMAQRKKVYDGLMKLADTLRTRVNVYVDQYGSLEPPATVVRDSLLDD